MDDTPITVRHYNKFEELKADEYRYGQCRAAYERLDAVDEMIETANVIKGWEIPRDQPVDRTNSPPSRPQEMSL